jgi:hypothetical protein
MPDSLFSATPQIGTFKGFTESGLEFAAEIVAPYQPAPELTPRTGQLLLVELDTPDEAIVGRITRFVPVGILAGSEGDEYLASMSHMNREVPEQLKEQRLRYSVRVKLLGGVRVSDQPGAQGFRFVPSVRKLPHLGARVAYPTVDLLRFVCRLGARGGLQDTPIGHYALGEVIYGPVHGSGEDFFVEKAGSDEVEVHFDVSRLVGKRTFVFARAGYGKSNLIKLLFAELYRSQPTTWLGTNEKPVGTLIFDPDGEYFWSDESNRPGLCDVPHLSRRIAVFTNRPAPNLYYGSWKAGDVRLDLRQCPPSEIVRLCIAEGRQDDQNVVKIRTVPQDHWPRLVDLLHESGYRTSDADLREKSGITQLGAAECNGMRSNLVPIIQTLHDPESALLRGAKQMLRDGRIVVVDVSLLSGNIALQVSGLLMNAIFNNNQGSFTNPEGAGMMPVIVVIEEAQSVLGKSAAEESPFVRWVKEGRKYHLGAVLVTQQPGSISPELLSQGDNFFAFHLLSAHDLKTLQFHNAHFSDDVLAHLLNEPIRGNAYFWSAPHQPFVLPARVRSFEHEYPTAAARRAQLDKAVDTGLGEVASAEERMVQRLAQSVRQLVTQGKLKVEAMAEDDSRVLIYKWHLAAKVAELMDDEERGEYCLARGRGKFAQDRILEKVIASTGLCDGPPDRVRGLREGETEEKDFYRFSLASLGGTIRGQGKVATERPGS